MTPEIDAHYIRAIAIYDALGELTDAAFVERDRARAWSGAGEHEKAIAIGQHALHILMEAGNDKHTAAAMDDLGLLYSDAGDRTTAIAWLERSSSLAASVDDTEGLPIVLCNLASEYVLADREGDAIECYRRALAMYEEDQNEDDARRIRTRLDELVRTRT
jgi:tetratricopeptide (TPR) repeat protein